ncbi:hypothetical protein H1164_17580 [Thermoactinomyces daqus]|jgi:ssDNA-binding Zn-finger/Zn-ribbon topoisomerase 1|uniref:Competence protein CoiA-like N-terminal domain-containing protein n=1 Tax=Thermoactinomyces daqus TaxID=1329516 RepID=A0A7W1XDF0_9BACL|nr:hypothetical protein [Thermoactinomyces daqus]MBA4544641.1 hypothetical protein [Thermoactinomyces daqus]
MVQTKIRPKYRRQYGVIPYGLSSTGKIILPKEANPQEPYQCPECKGKLILRLSKLKKPYFSHYPGEKRKCKLNYSSIALAKHVLRFVLDQWMRGKGDPVEVQLFCGERHEIPRDEINEIKLNQRIRFHQKRRYLSHLSLLDRYGQSILHIELREKSRVHHVKHPSWLEVASEEILSNPYLLSSLNPYMNTPYFLNPAPQQLSLF